MIRKMMFIIAVFNITQVLYGRGQGVSFGPDGKIQQAPVTEEEYGKYPGDNRTISVGDQLVVPAVVGSNYDTDLRRIKGYLYQFKIGKITRVKSKESRGTVISQSPKENILLAKPAFIDIVVSDGPKTGP